MPLIKILQPTEIKAYDSPPIFTGNERKAAFHIPLSVKEMLNSVQSPTNKVGLVLQYGYFKVNKRFYSSRKFHVKDIEFVARSLQIPIEDVKFPDKYFRNKSAEHQSQLITLFGFTPFSDNSRDLLFAETIRLSKSHLNPRIMFGQLVEFLAEKRITGVPYYVIQEQITDAINQSESGLVESLSALLSDSNKELLDSFTEESEQGSEISNGRSRLTLLRKINQSLKPGKINDSVSNFLFFKKSYEQLLPVFTQMNLSAETVRYFAETAIRGQAFQFSRREDSRFLYLFCFVEYQYFRYSDVLMDIFISSCNNNNNKCEQHHRDAVYTLDQEDEKQTNLTLIESSKIGIQYCEIIEYIRAVLADTDLEMEIKQALISEKIASIPINETKEKFIAMGKKRKRGNRELELLQIYENSSIKLQNRVSRIIQEIVFEPDTSDKHLYDAVSNFQKKEGTIGSKPPLMFLEDSEQDSLLGEDGKVRTSLYKVLLFNAIMDGIKSGEINLKYSYRYRHFDSYLIEKSRWIRDKSEILKQAGMEHLVSFQAIKEQLLELECRHFKNTNERIIAKENRHFKLHADGSFRVSTPKLDTVAMPSLSELLPKEKIISLYEVLSAVSKSCPVLKSFIHWQVKNSKGRPSDQLFFAEIMGYGCNIGIHRMANISQGISPRALENAVNWYFSQENLDSANNVIIELTSKLELTSVYQKEPGKNHTSSDGQKYVSAVDSMNAGFSHKYFGTGKGVTVYSFIDERHRLFHSTVITPSIREAAYVIDGLVANDVVQSSIHSTDTHGYTEIIFGVSHLMGVSFAPRIKKFQDQYLHTIRPRSECNQEGYLVCSDGQVDLTLIEKHWDDILRFIATIKLASK